MTNQTIMIMQEKPKTIDAGRKKELKKAALKTTHGGRLETPKPDKQRDVAFFENMIAESSTLEESRELYQKLGRDLIPEEKFNGLLERQFGAKTPEPIQQPPEKTPVPQISTQEQKEITEPKTEKSQPQSQGKVKIGQEEYPIENYEETAEDAEIVALRKVLASEISKLDKKLALLEKIATDTGSLGLSEDLRKTLSSRLSQLLDKKPGVGEKTIPEKDKTIAETIESIVLDSEEPTVDPDLKKIYQAKDKRKALDQCRDETWRKLLTLQQIDSGHDPVYELGRAYESGEISDADHTRITEEKELEKSFPDETVLEEKPADDLADETPDLYGFMEKTIQEQAQERARQQAERKRQRTATPTDEAELTARTKMRRMARMRRDGVSEEEAGTLEAVEAEFKPTPEMFAVSKEINKTRKIATERLHSVQSLEQLDETSLRTLEDLNFTFRHLESMRVTLRQMETLAREEFENQKEEARKLLGRATDHFFEMKPWPNAMGSKLRDALQKILSISIKEKVTKTKHAKGRGKKAAAAALEQFTERIAKVYAEGLISENEFMAKKRLTDSLTKSASPLGDLDTAFAEGVLEDVLTEEEYFALRKGLISSSAKSHKSQS
ncbi:MAG: hypothetical protein HYX20_01725 [Candidatus Yanofskybacteria bacterium]|nr:hypothetical protein [Candidatus Yanofskybacteria bacterium]